MLPMIFQFRIGVWNDGCKGGTPPGSAGILPASADRRIRGVASGSRWMLRAAADHGRASMNQQLGRSEGELSARMRAGRPRSQGANMSQ
jgi:hypothetical protein